MTWTDTLMVQSLSPARDDVPIYEELRTKYGIDPAASYLRHLLATGGRPAREKP